MIKNTVKTVKNYFDLQKPWALGWKEWDNWHADTKSARPFAYFVMETIPDKYDDFVKFFTKPINNLRYAIRVRLFDRYHVINTGLNPGYSDCDTRMLHGMFNMLVDFVEIERAWLHVAFSKEERKKRKHPWWCLGWTRFKAFRDADAGIAHLKWEMTLDSPNLSPYDQSPSQASSAREIWELYHWWKVVRPTRPDPYDVSGWNEHCESLRHRGLELFNFENETIEEKLRGKECIARSNTIEKSYDEEDEQMLIRLVKIRKCLWT